MAEDLDWIRIALKQAGKSRKGLADALGIQPSGVTSLLKGERRLKADEMRKAASYLETTPPDWRPPADNAAMPSPSRSEAEKALRENLTLPASAGKKAMRNLTIALLHILDAQAKMRGDLDALRRKPRQRS